jgi:hypothetical protein
MLSQTSVLNLGAGCLNRARPVLRRGEEEQSTSSTSQEGSWIAAAVYHGLAMTARIVARHY